MKRDRTLFIAFAAVALTGIAAPAMADPEVVTTQLVGYQETPQTINSGGSGNFVAKISEDGTSIEYEISYSGLSSTVLQSHIHFGRPATSGGIALFLCTNLGNAPATVPTPPPYPNPSPRRVRCLDSSGQKGLTHWVGRSFGARLAFGTFDRPVRGGVRSGMPSTPQIDPQLVVKFQ
jgi:CHRD domain